MSPLSVSLSVCPAWRIGEMASHLDLPPERGYDMFQIDTTESVPAI